MSSESHQAASSLASVSDWNTRAGVAEIEISAFTTPSVDVRQCAHGGAHQLDSFPPSRWRLRLMRFAAQKLR
jgi:hypothetical protein